MKTCWTTCKRVDKAKEKRDVSTTFYIPDPFIAWLFKQSKRILAASVAIGVIAFVASIVFRAVAMMVDTLHEALHSVLSFCISLNHVYMQAGPVGQCLIALITLACLLWIIYRGGLFLIQSYRCRGVAS